MVNYNEGSAQNSTAKPSPRKPGATAKVVVPTTLEITEKKVTRKRKAQAAEENTESEDAEDAPRAKKPKARPSAKKLDEETMPLAERTAVSLLKKRMYIGAHVSAAKGSFLFKMAFIHGHTHRHARTPLYVYTYTQEWY